ncbi:MAG: R3H domain-containing nucleic acid-binding protein [Cyanobacteriota bacterium]|nr:R3H domain-containing nucleic acid-binding protein [Cyanobacteriota bacterium]
MTSLEPLATPSADVTALLERAQAWLMQVLLLMGIPAQVQVVGEQLEIVPDSLSPEQQDILLGVQENPRQDPEGQGIPLDALQYLANTLLNIHQSEANQRSYTIELGGYRQKRQQELHEMALAAVEQVRSTQKEFEFKSLSAAERRQVHTYLDDPNYADLETFSRGKEPDRRLVIRLAHSDPSL